MNTKEMPARRARVERRTVGNCLGLEAPSVASSEPPKLPRLVRRVSLSLINLVAAGDEGLNTDGSTSS
jgi:hypothetical protein